MARRPVSSLIARAKRKTSEAALHMEVVRFLRYALPDGVVFFHVPNGEKRDAAAAGKLKAMGVLPGVPDLVFIMPKGQAAFIELKRPGEVLSDAQIALRRRLVACNCGYSVARSLDEVEQTVARWLAHFEMSLNARVAA